MSIYNHFNKVHYHTWGNRSHQAIILIHGIDNNLCIWDEIADGLAKYFYVVAIDIRGNGNSPWNSSAHYTEEDVYTDIRHVIDELLITSAVLVGHSLGGKLSLCFTARSPNIIEKLVLLDSSPVLSKSMQAVLLNYINEQPTSFSSIEDYVDYLTRTHAFSDRNKLEVFASTNVKLSDGRYEKKSDPAFALSMLSDDGFLLDSDVWRVMSELTCPVLIVRGKLSSITKYSEAERMLRSFRHASLIEVGNASHSIMLDQPKKVLDSILGFIMLS
ncbi:putative Carboxylesterase [Vibrio nigripulchritudo MADA3029]|uniref:alpha/beta fold hydrolase n=1 Tax=Vibrio nigripulchritudo TaxID=28173 RepID=UPI0003B235F9|nr:alpha/beta hydrolase [Vibrio nigripulchritudo]CCN38641.1 putative Carboxylesterase [Vibrio nigripulchritudo AM115]CCN44950.1 putative Carboxylesterase [Vibrio nigripulchritudo FTn2]CCN50808.1 putative Carboxylesterase [Vibrio nigripulchritudo MADA3020]CCN56666.1 putative Carboxylesterase [Vibrio nigripulchritudo MADA3021]CCN62523.1 putative Carboxylesterase [Vibrio nigripulchritudo MADA3029]